MACIYRLNSNRCVIDINPRNMCGTLKHTLCAVRLSAAQRKSEEQIEHQKRIMVEADGFGGELGI